MTIQEAIDILTDARDFDPQGIDPDLKAAFDLGIEALIQQRLREDGLKE